MLLHPKSAILGLPLLDPKDLCLPNQLSRRSWQKRSVSTYLTWRQRRNWVASMVELALIFNPSHVYYNMNIFWPSCFVTFPWHCWTELSQSLKDLRKPLQNHENLRSLTDLNGANIGFRSNSRDWRYFECSWCQKFNPLIKKSVLILQLLVDYMLIKLYLQYWVPGLQVLHSFLSKGSTWYVHLNVLVRFIEQHSLFS